MYVLNEHPLCTFITWISAQNGCQQSRIAARYTIGMTQAGMSLKEVASELHVSLRSVECWRELISREISREQASLWKGEIAEQGSKMIITESLGKRGKSTRDIARKLTDKDYCISNKAVYRCLRSHSSYTWRNRRHTRIYSKRHNNFTPRAVKMDTYFKTEFPIIFSEIRNLTALDR